jgi:glycosyltransferase involved in cell wall biosynthesis
VQLYRDADVVVVSCHENRYAAGVQTLMEAMACRRPVIATATRGLASYLHPSVIAVPPGDAAAMRAAIRGLLADPAGAEARAREGHAQATPAAARWQEPCAQGGSALGRRQRACAA